MECPGSLTDSPYGRRRVGRFKTLWLKAKSDKLIGDVSRYRANCSMKVARYQVRLFQGQAESPRKRETGLAVKYIGLTYILFVLRFVESFLCHVSIVLSVFSSLSGLEFADTRSFKILWFVVSVLWGLYIIVQYKWYFQKVVADNELSYGQYLPLFLLLLPLLGMWEILLGMFDPGTFLGCTLYSLVTQILCCKTADMKIVQGPPVAVICIKLLTCFNNKGYWSRVHR